MIGVNDYVRINMDNRNCIGIGRVSRIVNETIYVNMNNKYNLPVSFQIDKVVKHSKQLIDLIEIGDYVNGYRILAIEDSIYKNSKRILIYKNQKEKYERWIYIQEYDGKIHTQDDLVEILTKEQFEANCYKVGGEDEC